MSADDLKICRGCQYHDRFMKSPGGVCTKNTPASTFSCNYRQDFDGCEDWVEHRDDAVEICGECAYFRPTQSVPGMGICTHDLDLIRDADAPFFNTGYRALGGWPVTSARRSCRRWAIKQSSAG